MRYLSLCSGIEAASVAWAPLGWTPAAFAEIEAFPSAVLKHHHPDVPNLGDITKFREWPDVGAVELVCGGTPCQSFSVAGLRQGLADPRGNLALTFLAIVDRLRPRWVVWENVPGVLSSGGGHDFGAFLSGLGQLGYGWCYRVLDAQYVRVDGFHRAVPQRRRRVFVVGYLGDWRCAAAVLSEPQGLLGHIAPRRAAGQGTAHRVAPSLTGSGRGVERTGESRGQDPVVEVSPAVTAKWHKGSGGPAGDEAQNLVAVSPTLEAGVNRTGGTRPPGTTVDTADSLVAHSLTAQYDAGEDGTGRGLPLSPVWSINADAISRHGDVVESTRPPGMGISDDGSSYTLDASQPHAIAIQERAISENPAAGPDGAGVRDDGASYTLEARQVPQAVLTLAERGRDGYSSLEVRDDGTANALLTPNGGRSGLGVGAVAMPAVAFTCSEQANGFGWERDVWQTLDAQLPNDSSNVQRGVRQGWAVRRLMPVECERLMGFPDGYTAITYRGKPAADGPRYKALGNSWAVNCARWIGSRIVMVEQMLEEIRRGDAA